MVVIKVAQVSDAEILSNLARKTFIQTFADLNKASDMDDYLGKTFSTEKQLIEIQDSKRTIAMAWHKDEAIGFYQLFNGIPDTAVTGLQPIEMLRLYVDLKWHGKAVAKLLMDHAIEQARGQGFHTMWLGVWEKNFKAQAFYRKYSFKVIGSHIFTLGTDDQVDLILSCSL